MKLAKVASDGKTSGINGRSAAESVASMRTGRRSRVENCVGNVKGRYH